MEIPLHFIIYAIFALVVILVIWLIKIESRLAKFMRGNKAISLEDHIIKLIEDVNTTKITEKEIIATFRNLNARLEKSIQTVNTIRFDPYGEAGGKQSFATAFLDEKGDGVVFSTLYSRDRTSFFAKPVFSFRSEYELSREEIKVINLGNKPNEGKKINPTHT